MPEKKRTDITTAFLTDWRERMIKRQRRNVILLIGAVLVAFLICILAFGWFQNRNYQRIVQQNMNYIMDGTIQETNQIQSELNNAVYQIENFANQYAYMVKYQPETSITDRLTQIKDTNIFDRVAYISRDGMDTSLEGTADVSDRSYFLRGMSGEKGFEAIEKSRVTSRPTMVFYAPVKVDGKVEGVLVGFYEQERLDKMLTYEFFHYVPNSYLLARDGTVIAVSSEELSKENSLKRLSGKKYLGDTDYNDIIETINSPELIRVGFRFEENRNTKVGVIVQFESMEWMVLTVLPYEVTSEMVSNANASGRTLIIEVIIVFLITMTMLLFFYLGSNKRFEKEMEAAENSLDEALTHEQFQYSVIESLADIYSSVYFVDLADERYEQVKDQADGKQKVAQFGTWDDGINSYVDNFVAEQYQPELKKFMTAKTFIQRFEELGLLHMEYQRKDKGWRRAVMIPVKEAEDDGNKEIGAFVFAVQRIDEEKKRELDTKKALEEAYEAARLASDAKTAFLSNMSHDIRTPMNAIIGMTAIAGANLDSKEKISDCLKKINVSSKHLLGLINEVLDMSKIESGKVDLSEEEFSLSDLIDALVNLNRPLIKEKNHSLTVTIKNLVHEKVFGDSTRLQQVLTNLLSNAIKYTPENGKIDIIVTEKDTNKPTVGWFEVVIRDNGIGMSEEYMKNLFEPFVRSTDKRIQGIQGTGLGMPIAKNIIRMMNGDIKVESELNKGTTFTTSFVLRLQSEDDVNYEDFIDLPVLVVDDDKDACESTCLMLQSLEMDSEWVTSGKEAIEKVVEHHEEDKDFYAVIVDWKMPEMDGVEVTRQIRKHVGDEIPIIIISAYDWIDIEQEAREAGANAFLSKPLFKSKVVSLFAELTSASKGMKEEVREQGAYKVDFTGKRILLAEDNEINSEIAVELLGMSGFEIETAFNGKECLAMFRDSKPRYYDVILMDIQMPEMNGYEAAKAIRESDHPDAKKIPIIAMTANAFSSDVRAAYNAGMNGHIAKPIDINHVLKVLDEHIFQGGVNTLDRVYASEAAMGK